MYRFKMIHSISMYYIYLARFTHMHAQLCGIVYLSAYHFLYKYEKLIN